MSIIYDALKKVENGLNEYNIKAPKAERDKKVKFRVHKVYLIYLLAGCTGLLIANIFFKMLSPIPSGNNNVLTKKLAEETHLESTVSPPENNIEIMAEDENSFVLNGVFFSQDEGYALINNRIVKKGDRIDGAKVLRIDLDEVSLELAGTVIKLSGVK